jgi:polyphosphate kinase
MNNLEEQKLISRLYEASQAGVRIQLLVRGICCCIPGVAGMSENISISRIVDRYLEHGRVFIFHNDGQEEIFLGSSDWMNRNIYRRIEVCFPLYDAGLRSEICQLIRLQLGDNVAATPIDAANENPDTDMPPPVTPKEVKALRSQEAIYRYLAQQSAKPADAGPPGP